MSSKLTKENLKIVFMGTPEFAVPTLQALIDNNFNVIAVVTQPDKKKGRGKVVSPPPVKTIALDNNIEVLQPASIKKDEEFLKKLTDLAPDIIVVVAYGKILPKSILVLPKLVCINVHASILPYYRGAAPINRAIINGETEAGVTTMLMDEGMDTGDMLLVKKIPIEGSDTTLTLGEKLSRLGGDLLVETINKLDTINQEKQTDDDATYAPLLKKEDGHIDWSKSANEIDCFIRGMSPWPGAFGFVNNKKYKIIEGSGSDEATNLDNGEIVSLNKTIGVASGGTVFEVKVIQAEGKKPMESSVFINGNKLKIGDRFV